MHKSLVSPVAVLISFFVGACFLTGCVQAQESEQLIKPGFDRSTSSARIVFPDGSDHLVLISGDEALMVNHSLRAGKLFQLEEGANFLGSGYDGTLYFRQGQQMVMYSKSLEKLSSRELSFPPTVQPISSRVPKILSARLNPRFVPGLFFSRSGEAGGFFEGFNLEESAPIAPIPNIERLVTAISAGGALTCQIYRDGLLRNVALTLKDCGAISDLPIARILQSVSIRLLFETSARTQYLVEGDKAPPVLVTILNDERVVAEKVPTLRSEVHPALDARIPIVDLDEQKVIGFSHLYVPFDQILLDPSASLPRTEMVNALKDVQMLHGAWVAEQGRIIFLNVTTSDGRKQIRRHENDETAEYTYSLGSFPRLHMEHSFEYIDRRPLPVWIIRASDQVAQRATLYLHGGPFSGVGGVKVATGPWLERGYDVIAINYDGSNGYGARYSASLLDTSPTKIAEQISLYAGRYKRENNVSQISIVANSYGGLIARELIRISPELFTSVWLDSPMLLPCELNKNREKALAVRQLGDTKSFEESWIDTHFREYTDEGCSNENEAVRSDFETFTDFGSLFLLQGENDRVVAGESNLSLFESKSLGRCSEIVSFEAEHHGSMNLDFRQDLARRFLDCTLADR